MKTFLKAMLSIIIAAAIIIGMFLGIELIIAGIAWLVIFLKSSAIGKIIACIVLWGISITVILTCMMWALIIGTAIADNIFMAIKKIKNKRSN